jgi:hypothetical protein
MQRADHLSHAHAVTVCFAQRCCSCFLCYEPIHSVFQSALPSLLLLKASFEWYSPRLLGAYHAVAEEALGALAQKQPSVTSLHLCITSMITFSPPVRQRAILQPTRSPNCVPLTAAMPQFANLQHGHQRAACGRPGAKHAPCPAAPAGPDPPDPSGPHATSCAL